MAMGYVDCPYLLTLDLPGGKRHLGESTLRGVIREVEEECSLAIDYEYLFSRVSDRYGGGLGPTKTTTNAVVNDDEDAMVRVLTSRGKDCHDVFFVVTPPPQSILH
jgi:8-oxo-dGTP pyrophosphatase MutT (NUDIX family)